MESYGPLVPIWVQAIIIALVIFILVRYSGSLSMKWTGIAWGVICLLSIVAFKVDYFYNIASNIVGTISAIFFYKIISTRSKMPKAANIAVAFALTVIWLILFMFILGWIFDR
ncbi:hypothetical protein EFS28_06425 [Lactobacillus acidophilus]|uniref:hypothetical protein n=1 Tax=Lactobacillus acidophilus TaxID=1579 RepID=UPI0021A6960C|nr:hypothetical protein [Lactobacillus acidophilus]MCT3602666.1 hypothetical protein [Lactobacillus acidophilus]MCT3623856.1 hypothetical protein [Lactobacillus acidophilus]